MKSSVRDARPKSGSQHYARVEARVSPELKRLFQEAADLRGVTLSDFVINSVHDAATQTVEQHRFIQLSREASLQFAEALLRPPESHPRRLAAARRYLKRMDGA